MYEDLSNAGYHRDNKSGGQTTERQESHAVACRTVRSTRNAANGHVGPGTRLAEYRHVCILYYR